MTIRQIAKKLASEGHKVTLYHRKDGGVLIKKIDGVRYTGAKGNAVARAMTGETLSETRDIQLAYAKTAKKWKRGKLPSSVGELNYERIKKRAKTEGVAEIKRQLSEKEKYASGIAYTENIRVLVAEIRRCANIYESQELHQLADDIWSNADSIRDEWIMPAYDALYEINGKHSNVNNITQAKIKDIVNQVRSILHI